MTERTAEYVRRQCLELVFRQSLSGIFANLAVALLLAGLLAGEVSGTALGAWVVIMVTVAAARLALQRVHHTRISDLQALRRWYRWYFLLMAVLGATWGLGGAVFFYQADSIHQFILFLVLGGLVVAGVPFMAPVYACYFVYTAAVLLPLTLTVLLKADATSVTLATMLCVFTVALLITAHFYRRKLSEALELAHENIALVAELRDYREQLEHKVTERTQALQEANQEMEAFNYSVSHDLRAPLRAIDGFSAILLEQYAPRFDAQGRDLVDRLRAATQRMDKLIDALLTLSRLSRCSLQRETVDLSALANGIVRQMREANPGRSVAVDVQSGLRDEADKQLVSVVLQNLLSNAWKYTQPVDAATIRVGGREESGRRVFFVTDNGVGFDMAHAAKLFGAFQRLHSESEFEGTGIGLATVARIVRLHGGSIWAESRPGEGATFCFTLREPAEGPGNLAN